MYGLTYNHDCEVKRRCFRLLGEEYANHQAYLLSFVTAWHGNMVKALVPSRVLAVDESIGGYLVWSWDAWSDAVVPRKPTPARREAHTAARAEIGVVVFYEVKERMPGKEFFVDIAGKSPYSKALPCVKS